MSLDLTPPLCQLLTLLTSNIREIESYGSDFHADHSFEPNPPLYTILRMIRHPPTGGDTLFTSQQQLYEALSPVMKETLSGLNAVHSSEARSSQAYVICNY